MKIPSTLKIGGHDVKVLYPHRFRQNSDLCGQADYGLTEIRVSDTDPCGEKRSESSEATTLLHEIVHWVAHVYYGEKALDEQLVCALSHGLLQVLRDNKLRFDEV